MKEKGENRGKKEEERDTEGGKEGQREREARRGKERERSQTPGAVKQSHGCIMLISCLALGTETCYRRRGSV